IKSQIRVQTIKGNILYGIELTDVAFIIPSGDSITAQKIYLSYRLLSFITPQENKINKLVITKPVLYLTTQPSISKNNLNFNYLLPLLNIDRLQVINGKILKDTQTVYDSLSILCQLSLKPQAITIKIFESKIQLTTLKSQFNNIQGKIIWQNNTLSMTDIRATNNSLTINFDARYMLTENKFQISLHNFNYKLNNPNSQLSGILDCNGEILIDIVPFQWQIKNISADIFYKTKELKIQNNYFPDGGGTITIQNQRLNLEYLSHLNNNLLTNLSLIADLKFNPLTYEGELIFNNLPLSIKPLQDNYISGKATIRGIETNKILIGIFASAHQPKIESIIINIKIYDRRIEVERLSLKDNYSVLDVRNSKLIKQNKLFDNYDITFNNFSLELLSQLLNPYLNLKYDISGVANGNLTIQLHQDNISSSAKINIENGSYYNLNFKKINLAYQLNDIKKIKGLIEIKGDSVSWHDKNCEHFECQLKEEELSLYLKNILHSSIEIDGILSTDDHEIVCNVRKLQITTANETINSINPFSVGKKDSLFYLKDILLAIGSGLVTINITKESHYQPQFSIIANNINLSKIANLLQMPYPINGLINFSFINQSKQNNILLHISGYELEIPTNLFNKNEIKHHSNIKLKSINGEALFLDSILFVNTLKIVHNYDTSQIYGTLNINRESINQMPINLNITFNDPGAWLFFFLKDIIDVQSGKIYGQGRIQGTIKDPILDGQILISESDLLIVNTNTPCHNVSAQLDFEKTNIYIKNLQGTVSSGTLYSYGIIKLLELNKVDTLSISILLNNAPLQPDKDIFTILNGSLNIDMKTTNAFRGENLIVISGDITIKEALITKEFESSLSLPSKNTQNIYLNLKITGERDIWLRNQMCDIEFSANLNIFNQDDNQIYSGSLTALQGNFYYLDHTLKISKGEIIFDNISELNPHLDINAELATRQIQIQPDQTERIKIILSLTGRLNEPTFKFYSDPPYLSENDILSYLTLNVTWQEMSAFETRELLTNVLSTKFIGYFERELMKRIRNLIYLDYLWIESGLINGNGARVKVGKYISSNLYFSYEYDISGNVYDIFRIEYFFARSHEVIGEHDNDGRYRLKYQYKIRY
ncbi:MAG: translocation/assembly module TamB domain-containing protein, partial [candidate division WOR-3 bacterium]